MFRGQFTLTARKQKGLHDLCVYFSLVYIKAWITAPLAVKAPDSDLCFLKSLSQYTTTNKVISSATCENMMRHLCYLSEESVGLSLFLSLWYLSEELVVNDMA